MKIIKLTQGKQTVVDDVDYEYLKEHKWQFNKGYAVRGIKIKGKSIKEHMHRVILNAPNNLTVDHINRDKLDNRKVNLRLATLSQNKANTDKIRGVSRYKGVTWNNLCKKWQVYICLLGKPKYVGVYSSENEAARAYNNIANKCFGDFAVLNNINFIDRELI